MFRLLSAPEPAAGPVTITVDGAACVGLPGETVASLLLRLGHVAVRTSPASGQARGPYCLMGVCYECLVEIDGRPGRQACMTEIAEGMRVRRGVP